MNLAAIMVSKDAIIPIASLSAIVVVCLIFVIWWFPRTWAKGNADETRIMNEEIQRREAYMTELHRQQQVNRANGNESDYPPSETAEVKPPPYVVTRPTGYVPPVTSY